MTYWVCWRIISDCVWCADVSNVFRKLGDGLDQIGVADSEKAHVTDRERFWQLFADSNVSRAFNSRRLQDITRYYMIIFRNCNLQSSTSSTGINWREGTQRFTESVTFDMWLLRLGSWEARRSPSSIRCWWLCFRGQLGTWDRSKLDSGNSQLSSLIRTEIES